MYFTSPFEQPGHWFKGNLHTHSTQSDGLLSPDEVISWYRSRGYDFVALSDHWVLTRGKTVDHDFITLSAAEVQGADYHLLTLGLCAIPPDEYAEDLQAMIDHLQGQGALCYMAHPYWTGQTSASILSLPYLDGLEVFNAVCEASKGTGHARVHWDDCLSAGRRLTGLAVDDSHWRHNWEGIGYVMVRSQTLDEAGILRALAQGDFYSSTGPVIEDLRVVTSQRGQPEIYVRCSPCKEIVFYAAGSRGQRFASTGEERLTHARLPIDPEQIYVRVECRDDKSGCAWSNPVYITDILS